jgi:hypothetical protein
VTRRRDRGSVTAELAAALPALMLLLLFALGSIDAVLTRMRCVDAARDAALAASRGEDGAAAGHRLAPGGATVGLSVGSDTVRATVSAPVRVLGAHLPTLTVSGTAVAAREPETAAGAAGAGGSAEPAESGPAGSGAAVSGPAGSGAAVSGPAGSGPAAGRSRQGSPLSGPDRTRPVQGPSWSGFTVR